jgi:hypothetical protein
VFILLTIIRPVSITRDPTGTPKITPQINKLRPEVENSEFYWTYF